MLTKNKIGQSLVEVIVAVSIFMIISSSAAVSVVGSLSASRLAEEETQATFYSNQGLEAVRSIKNRGWDDPFLTTDCTSVTCGLTLNGQWSFNGNADDPDGSGKFLRELSIENVERDIDGNVVDSGGKIDSETKRVVSTIKWDFTSGRQNEVVLTSLLTNWQESVKQNTCFDYCKNYEYLASACRRNAQACNQNGEVNASNADQFCPGGSQEDTCCCS